MALAFSSHPQKYDMEIPIKHRPLINEEGLSSSQQPSPPKIQTPTMKSISTE
jgi:hypothetical protein